MYKEAVLKRRPQSGGRGLVQCGQGAVIQMRTSALFGAKNFGFFEINGVSARTRDEGSFEPVRTFCGQGEGSIFHDFVRTSFMDDP